MTAIPVEKAQITLNGSYVHRTCIADKYRHLTRWQIAAAAGHAELCDFLLGDFTCYRIAGKDSPGLSTLC